MQSDSCRGLQLRCHTAREGHLFRKFGWGNRKSLVEGPAAAGLDVRAQLLQYYRWGGWAGGQVGEYRYVEGGWGNCACPLFIPPPPAATVAALHCTAFLLAGRREQYSAERMSLVVLGAEDLDTLQQVGWRGGWKASRGSIAAIGA